MIFDNIRGWMPGSDYSPAESVHTTISLARFNILERQVEHLTSMAAARAVEEEGQPTIAELARDIKKMRDEARTAIVNEVQREMRERVNHVANVVKRVGFKLTAFKEPNGPAFIIYQPYRSDNGQEKIMPESHDKMVEMLNAA